WCLSFDGLRIAIGSQDRLRGKVRIIDLETGTEHDIVLPEGWSVWNLAWSADGAALFAATQSTSYQIARIGLNGTASTLLDRGRSQWLNYPCPSPDGRQLAFSQRTYQSNVWLLENF